MKVAILGNHIKREFKEVVNQLILEFGSRRCEAILLEAHTPLEGFDLAISVGGDGTFLESTIRIGQSNIPILGVNVGRLGFLADNSEDCLPQLVTDLCDQRYHIGERNLLELVSPHGIFDFKYALNEIAILKNDSSSMITVHTHIDGIFVNSYWCDGLLIVSPTGSTAYSLSVGGPIMTPQSQSLIITPVAPHSLNVRPIVVSNDVEITLEVACRSGSFMLALDSRSKALPIETTLKIRKAAHTIKIIERPNHNYFETLRNKLMWGADRRN